MLLESVASLRVLTTRQVQRLLFPSEQVALRRLRMLAAAGLIRLDHSVVSPHRLVTVTPAGHAAAGTELRAAVRPRHPLFLQHQLGVNAFRIALGQACACRSDLELLGFIGDTDGVVGGPRLQRALHGVLGVRGGHVPDGMFGLRRGGRSALFFFEFDRGTEVIGSPARGLGRIIHSYLASLAGGDLRRAGELLGVDARRRGFRALVVTTTPARVRNIRNHWAGVSGSIAAGQRFIWLTSADALETTDLLTERWVPLDAKDARTYTILGDET
ncbi:MAG: replication-relaxation family protein [Minicystis sp.]